MTLFELGVASAASAVVGAVVTWRRRRATLAVGEERRHQLCVVVTGSTRGLGFALAKEFVQHGDSVVVNGRSASSVEAAKASLLPYATEKGQQVLGCVCDVADATQCDALASKAQAGLGKIDLWVNNAGMTQHPKAPLAQTPPSTVVEVVSANLLGTIFGCRAAIGAMSTQPTGGTIFNMDGSGSRGNATASSLAYGASKAALPQISKTLASETRGTAVRCHLASPGMVTTELLLRDANARALRIFNILAEPPETVARWLVPRMRAAHVQQTPSGLYLRFLTPPSVVWRFATAAWRKDRLIKVPAT